MQTQSLHHNHNLAFGIRWHRLDNNKFPNNGFALDGRFGSICGSCCSFFSPVIPTTISGCRPQRIQINFAAVYDRLYRAICSRSGELHADRASAVTAVDLADDDCG